MSFTLAYGYCQLNVHYIQCSFLIITNGFLCLQTAQSQISLVRPHSCSRLSLLGLAESHPVVQSVQSSAQYSNESPWDSPTATTPDIPSSTQCPPALKLAPSYSLELQLLPPQLSKTVALLGSTLLIHGRKWHQAENQGSWEVTVGLIYCVFLLSMTTSCTACLSVSESSAHIHIHIYFFSFID